jgi:hypothetical protein
MILALSKTHYLVTILVHHWTFDILKPVLVSGSFPPFSFSPPKRYRRCFTLFLSGFLISDELAINESIQVKCPDSGFFCQDGYWFSKHFRRIIGPNGDLK